MATHTHLRLSRRAALHTLGSTTIGAIALPIVGPGLASAAPAMAPSAPASPLPMDLKPLLAPLDEQVRGMMATYNVPGVSVGLLLDRQPHTAGWGVTNLDYPAPV